MQDKVNQRREQGRMEYENYLHSAQFIHIPKTVPKVSYTNYNI
jgi:hypothetical protein